MEVIVAGLMLMVAVVVVWVTIAALALFTAISIIGALIMFVEVMESWW